MGDGMANIICPNCGDVTEEGDFCSQCGFKLNVNHKGFFNKIDEKISLSTLIFAFIILGVFLFIGSLFWGIFTSNGSIGFTTNILLTTIFAVFFGGMFIGCVNCTDNSYIVPNFLVYLGTIAAAIVCGIGSLFAITSAFTSALSSVFSPSVPSGYGGNSYSASSLGGGSDTGIVPSLLSNFMLEFLIIIMLIPAASYLGIYLGYIIRNSLD